MIYAEDVQKVSIKRSAALVALLALVWSMINIAHAESKNNEFLFVQSSKNISFKNGSLILHNVAPVTTFFSDRPERITGGLRNISFLKYWGEGWNNFKSDPPNASLSVFTQDGQPMQAVIVLSNPQIDGDKLHYDVRVLEGTIPEEGGETVLFIDGGRPPCSSPSSSPNRFFCD